MVSYRIVIRLDNETLETIEDIHLNHTEIFEQPYTFTPTIPGDRIKLEFLLYQNGGDEVSRSLYLWLTVHPD